MTETTGMTIDELRELATSEDVDTEYAGSLSLFLFGC